MFNREIFKNGLRKIMTDWTEAEIDARADVMEQKYSTIKHGENVVHLQYSGSLIQDNSISEIERILAESNLELSRFDSDGIATASLEDLALQIALIVNDKTTHEILVGLATSGLWDTIKASTFYVWKTVRNRTVNVISASGLQPKKMNFGVTMSINNATFDFKIDGDLSEEAALESLDKVLVFLRELKPSNSAIQLPGFVTYNKKSKKWEEVDLGKEYQKLAQASNKKKKK